MSFTEITLLLEKTIGLDPDSIGHSAIQKGIERRMLSSSSPDVTHYHALLQQSPLELNWLIEEVVVAETWFFRELGAFDALRKLLSNGWAKKVLDRPLEVACIPCSTGEEPYSVAMCLNSHGLSRSQYNIDAIDISEVALRRAKEAIYSEVSFRNSELSFRDQYFNKTDLTYKLKPSITKAINFYQGNALSLPAEMMIKKYDVIFCRNLMIYLGEENRNKLISQFERILTQTGVIFVGYSEARVMSDAGFDTLDYAKAFAFSRSDDASHTNKRKRHNKREIVKPPIRKLSKTASKTQRVKPARSASKKIKENTASSVKSEEVDSNDSMLKNYQFLIADAQHHADRGQFEEAKKLCENYLNNHENNTAPIYFLLGVICEAEGNKSEAEKYFRKVIYLEPDNRDGLLHLSLLAEMQGDTERAKNLKSRIAKLINKDEMTNG